MNKASFNDQFLRACRGEATDHTPVWYMRQAGRYQAEYRKIREKYSFHEMNLNPEVAAEVTRFAVEQLGVDSAILFADIMTPLPSIGVDVEIKSGVGPVIDNPIKSRSDIDRLGELDPLKDIPYVMETIKMLREQLSVPLIGFSGAPFTVASYMIEGGPSKNYHKTKAFMYSDPEGWYQLMNKLGDMTIAYLTAQVKAGAQAIQLFDSWVGALNDMDYRTYIAPVMNRIFSALKELNVPLLMFGVGASHLIQEWNKLPVDVIGIDWRISIKKAREVEGIKKPLMGNLEPALLLAPWEVIEQRTKEILDQGMETPGFIFNLGHGVFPQVQVETLQRLTNFVHEYTRKNS
ncbi:uroporphyrinogen decarboxylase [Guptibacillus hwajinpoensis]|uniref:uroporphyrinogen decarboxylase n=1 Tax=Guptibacillus hwajinpoensis TaxID=208199 RepID=UPI001CFD064B|nr:uroporphyrinogen decarboxylase [Pseudalkalibacillus hwajinpoensis]WLR58487.1 uroporphyrinogen decarboxylase [Pseudalkalibacillus hwajinpoensis]